MSRIDCDVTILGSGLGGSLLAMALHRQGRKVVLLDRYRHPRFAIGESSTPIADMLLARLCCRYSLPRIAPLATYGATRQMLPHLSVGLKRGFSYFGHNPGQPFAVHADHRNEVLVAASRDDESADAHWLRKDIDAFLARQAQSMGIDLIEDIRVEQITSASDWTIQGRSGQGPLECHCRFIVDATGPAGILLAALGIPKDAAELRTSSRCLYAHFRDVTPWDDLLRDWGAARHDHPYPCERAALHHMLEGGWMWQLTFDSGIMSAGFVMSCPAGASAPPSDAKMAWDALLSMYPSLQEQFQKAHVVAPTSGMVATGRLQYLSRSAAGEGWICLPSTAGFIDPLHSSGIAHTLSAVWRLAHLFERHWASPVFPTALLNLGAAVRQEIRFVDRLVAGCYQTMPDFSAFSAFSMLYFIATIGFETKLSNSGIEGSEDGFLCADDPRLVDTVSAAETAVQQLKSAHFSPDRVRRFVAGIRRAIEPLNTVGLLDERARNMYRHTAPLDKLRMVLEQSG